MNTKRNNDPFAKNSSSPFGAPRTKPDDAVEPKLPSLPKPVQKTPPTGGTVPVPQLPRPVTSAPKEPAFPQLPQPASNVPAYIPGVRKPTKGSTVDLFPDVTPYDEIDVEVDEYVEEPEVELTDAEIYEELFDEPMPEGWDPNQTITFEEDEQIARRFDASVSPAALPTLYALASDADWKVRSAVASNEDTPESLLKILSTDSDSMVRENVMEHPNCPDDIYRNFWQDEDDDVVVDWIEFERTTEDMLRPLYNTDDDFIASILVESPLVPLSVKNQLKAKHRL